MNNIEEAIFHTASEIKDPPARAAFLDRACGAEGEMRVRIEALLVADLRSRESLASNSRDGSGLTSAPSAPPAFSPEGPGTRIGRYQLLEKIGEGGMGSVYLAEQEEPVKRRVALKIIKLGMDTKQVIPRFEAERQALAMMDHPHIARVLDAGTTLTGRPYFVMELLQGKRITTYCHEHALSVPQRLELFIQVCQAVQHAHQKGIIHRDLKPSNILVAQSEEDVSVKVIDFGITRAMERPLTDKTLYTEMEHQVGTPAYMSPEQVSLTGKDTDTRSDIYSLGVLLYELLTGSPPFDPFLLSVNGVDSLRRMVCEVEPLRPSTRLFESDGLDASFLPDGQNLISGDSKGVRFWDVRSLGSRVLHGHKSFVYPALLSPDGVTIYSGGWDGFVGQPGSLRFWDTATGAADSYIRAAALSVDGSRLAVSVRAGNESFNRLDILDTTTGEAVASISELGQKSSVPQVDSLAFDPSGQTVFCVNDHDGVAYLVDARTGAVRKSQPLFSGGVIHWRVAWSPDGATIAAGYGEQGGGVLLLDPQSLTTIRRWPHDHGGGLTSVAFSPDSRRLLTTSEDQFVRVWDAVTGTHLHDLDGHGNTLFCAVYSPDGKRIASGGRDNNVWIWDAEMFEPVARLGGHEDYVYSLAWRADSQQIISGSGDRTVRIWDTQPLALRVQARRERQTILAAVDPMVQRLFAELGDAGQVVERIKADTSLSTRERQIALQVALRMSLDRINAAARLPTP